MSFASAYQNTKYYNVETKVCSMGRLKSNATASDTTLGVLLASDVTASGNVMTVNAAVGSDTVYFTYEVTEFMTSHAT